MNDSLLKLFKQRMRIGYDTDDENLKAILESSVSAIEKLTGSDDLTDPAIRELVIERSRYVYNDSLEFFYDNFINDLGTASIANLKKAVTDDEANV
ncbi:phage head-tail connector protein [Enterococcus cecorum]|uniref:phage head-tail connector protein n=1 Tax=Enterococcus cecorum TaxID=44008 RepID=UPI003267A961